MGPDKPLLAVAAVLFLVVDSVLLAFRNRGDGIVLVAGLLRAPFNSLREFLGKRMSFVLVAFGGLCIGFGAWPLGLVFLGMACVLILTALAIQVRAETSGLAETERAASEARREWWRSLSVQRRIAYVLAGATLAAVFITARILVGRLWTD